MLRLLRLWWHRQAMCHLSCTLSVRFTFNYVVRCNDSLSWRTRCGKRSRNRRTFFNKAPKGHSKTPFCFPNAFTWNFQNAKNSSKTYFSNYCRGRQQLLPRSLAISDPHALRSQTPHHLPVFSWLFLVHQHSVPKQPPHVKCVGI